MPAVEQMKSERTLRQPKLREVFWLEQRARDVPGDNSWLSDEEEQVVCRLRFPKRHSDWRLGRWTAKRAISAYLHLQTERQDLSRISICAAADGAPEVRLAGSDKVSISISHRQGVALCAVAEADTALGCDLEMIEPRSQAFIQDYFQDYERRCIESADHTHQALMANLFWSAKESALKAMRSGLRRDTRSLNVVPAYNCQGNISQEWRRLRVEDTDGDAFEGWWQCDDSMLRTVVAMPAPKMPTLLQ